MKLFANVVGLNENISGFATKNTKGFHFIGISTSLTRNFLSARPDEGAVVVGGAVTKGNRDFPPEAASVAHQKPLPTHQKTSKGPNSHISQPRKFNN